MDLNVIIRRIIAPKVQQNRREPVAKLVIVRSNLGRSVGERTGRRQAQPPFTRTKRRWVLFHKLAA
eukprot:1182531-Pyramimonas_sp.AAC.2